MQAWKSWILGGSLCVAFAMPAAAAGVQTQTTASSPDGLRLEVNVDVPAPTRIGVQADGRNFTRFEFAGCMFEGSPGAPELSVASQLVALPPGGTATLRILQADVVDLGTLQVAPRAILFEEGIPASGRTAAMQMPREEIRWDPRAYAADGARNEAASLGEIGMLRHQRVARLEIRPLLFDPATSRARLVRRLRLEIVLQPGPVTAAESDPAGPRFATSASWERIYSGALLNPKQAELWRRAPQRVVQKGGPLPSGLLRPGLLGEDEWKLRARATGPTRVTAAALGAAGFPAGTPTNRLRLYLRRYAPARPLDPDILEIPMLVVDVDTDGVFDPEDSFVFYAEHPRDDATSEDRFARYSAENIYWLAVAASGTPARIPVRPRLTGTTNGPSTFEQQLTYEEDRTFNSWVYGSNSELVDSAALYFWTGRFPVATSVTVAVPGRAAGASLEICADTQEDMESRPYRLYALSGARDSVLLGNNFGTNPPENQAPAVQTTCGVAPAASIDPGDIRIILRPFNSGGLVPFMDRIKLRYQATYTATANRIRCTSGGATGPVAFAIGGFSDSGLRAFDITNPKTPATFDLTGAYSGGTLTLTDNVTAGSERIYLVVPDATIPSIAAERDASDDDVQILQDLSTLPLGTYDVLVVANDEFSDDPNLAQWLAWRSSQGHRIRKVRTSDVYDAFRGGLPHYEAIHRLTQLAFTNWGIQFIVLVGDGSEDPVRLFGDSGPNYVPSRMRYFKVPSSSGGPAEYRNDMNDKYYTQVAGSALDVYPDLLLGRLPVGSADELAAVVQKTMLYETPASGDNGAWRKRVLMLSDDEWVKRTGIEGFPGPAHIRGCSEPGFQRSIVRCADIVDGAFPGDLHAVRFLLRDHSDRLYPTVPEHRPVSLDSSCVVAAPHATSGFEQSFYFGVGDGQVGKALVDSVGDGCLFLALQSHANRVIVADEQIMSTIERPFAPAFHNDGKPFVFFGYGCHLNEFGPVREQGDQITAGDALGEYLVLTPSRGAVASYASTGFEFLGENNLLHENTWDVIFNKRWSVGVGGRVVDSDTLAARWLLSDLLQIGELRIVDPGIIARYVLFGDPMLRLDAGVPRVAVNHIDNGFLQPNGRLVVTDPKVPLGMEITLRDEQGIDSLWVVKRFRGGTVVPIDSVRVRSEVDTLGSIAAKRSYTVAFTLLVDRCDFDIVVGARDLAGRTSEFIGKLLFDQRLLANGVPIHDGDRVDPHTAFRFEILGCTPIPPPLPLQVFVDGMMLSPAEVQLSADSASVNWGADFTQDLANGSHVLSFQYEGSPLVSYAVEVGSFGMSEVLIFPNPMRKQHDVMRMYFHLGEPIAGGTIRVLTMSGRTVLSQDLATPGVVQSDISVPPGSIGSGTGQDSSHWNYVELFRDGRDLEGDAVANGVYLVELSIRGTSGQQQRKRDKLVIMR